MWAGDNPFTFESICLRFVPMETLRIGQFELSNRLFVGTGKYATYDLMQQALEASAC